MKKRIICICVLLALCIVGGVIYAAMQREPVKNDVFTDELFADMTGICQYAVPLYILQGDDAEEVVSVLQHLRLEPAQGRTADFPIEEEGLVDGDRGYCIVRGDEVPIAFELKGSTLYFEGNYYHILDQNGELTNEYTSMMRRFFYPVRKQYVYLWS